jgi:cell envelope opacity-associated protein A
MSVQLPTDKSSCRVTASSDLCHDLYAAAHTAHDQILPEAETMAGNNMAKERSSAAAPLPHKAAAGGPEAPQRTCLMCVQTPLLRSRIQRAWADSSFIHEPARSFVIGK